MKKQIEETLKKIAQQVYPEVAIDPKVERSTYVGHGEYSSAVAMQLAKILKKSPQDIAGQFITALNIEKDKKNSPIAFIESVSFASPGFLNLKVQTTHLGNNLDKVLEEKEKYGRSKRLAVSSQQSAVSSGKKENRLNKQKPRTTNHLPAMLRNALQAGEPRTNKIMVEFAHPNTHKAMHIGHLRNLTTGEAIVRLLEAVGYNVIRANYQGDVGMHIAKCLYGILQAESGTCPPLARAKGKCRRERKAESVLEEFNNRSIHEKIDFLGKTYASGSSAFEEDEKAKKEILELNKAIYRKDQSIWELYQTTRKWSLDYFELVYKRMGSHFDRYYFESEVYESGKATVLKALEQGIFERSDGAIIFPGEKYALPAGRQGLHNRVFVTSEGNPTYEGKDMGLGKLQFSEYHPDQVVHVVGPEQASYFQVVFKALELLFPETKGKEFHLVYGFVKLKHGKMSSRTGNVVLAWWLLEEAKKAIAEILKQNHTTYKVDQIAEIIEKTGVAAVKYSFLKVATKSEIAFDLGESVSFSGDSGPYLQYTYARCMSVLKKATTEQDKRVLPELFPKTRIQVSANAGGATTEYSFGSLNPVTRYNLEERAVARQIAYFPEIVSEAAATFAPSVLCNYLFELAQSFNLFYAKHSILGNQQSAISNLPRRQAGQHLTEIIEFRLKLTAAAAQVIKNGLYLLGIETLEQM